MGITELHLTLTFAGTARVVTIITRAVGSDKSGNADDTAKRKAHEATEAKRKAEWDAGQQAKSKKRMKLFKR